MGDDSQHANDADPIVEAVTTPNYYEEGMLLDLKVDWTDVAADSEEHTLFTIIKVFPVSLSPTMVVQWNESSGQQQSGVLKFFDRRASRRFRGADLAAHSPSVEACWIGYVQSGHGPELFKELQELNGERADWAAVRDFDANELTADTWETTARKEGERQFCALDFWMREIKAYERLKDLQGKCIPTFYGSTSFDSDCPPG